MRLLVLSWYSPEDPDSGERVRLAGICEGLGRDHSVTVLTFDVAPGSTNPAAGTTVLGPPDGERVPYGVPIAAVVRSTLLGQSVYRRLLGGHRHARARAHRTIAELDPDVILVNQLPPWSLVPEHLHDRVVVDTHNAEQPRLLRMAEAHPRHSPRRRIILRQARAARRLEEEISRRAGSVWAVSETDAAYFAELGGRVAVVPNGVSVPRETWLDTHPDGADAHGPVRLLFVGSLGYTANLDALRTFRRSWATGVDDVPWTLSIVGSGDPGEAADIVDGDPRITLVGRVDSVTEWMLGADAVVAPMRMGGGSRLKVLEALAHGVPLLSTRMGAEGVDLVAGRHFLAVEDAGDFGRALRSLRDHERTRHMVEDGLEVVRSLSWDAVGEVAARDLASVQARRST